MQVDEVLPYEGYYRDARFAAKIPDFKKGKVIYKCGDNIYQPLPNGEFRQLQSMHSNGSEENPERKAHDLGGVNVLVSATFHYFGSSGPELTQELSELKVGRAHKNRFSQETIAKFLQLIASYPKGINAPPTKWPSSDDSWRSGQV